MPLKLQITVDCGDPHAQCAWWADRLGLDVDDAHDIVVQLLEAGTLSDADVVMIDGRLAFADGTAASDPSGMLPRMYFQLVPEGKVGKNRLHIDIQTRAGGQDALQTLVDQWVGVGAALDHFDSQPGHRWAVMHDPEGNEFCLS